MEKFSFKSVNVKIKWQKVEIIDDGLGDRIMQNKNRTLFTDTMGFA